VDLWYIGRVAEKYKRNPNTSCVICGKSIYRRPFEIEKNKGNIFCGSGCYGISCRKENPCVVCGQLILSSLRKKICSRSCSNKNRIGIQYKINSPKDKVKAQRSIKQRLLKERGEKCERCGFQKYNILQMHHKDRDRNNNNMNNMEIICPNCHAIEHYLEKS
jgi:hypothetical protein